MKVYEMLSRALKPAVKVVPGAAHALTVMGSPVDHPAGPAWIYLSKMVRQKGREY